MFYDLVSKSHTVISTVLFVTQVSQVQLAPPILTLIWAALLLGEQLTWLTLLGAAAVIACALSAVRVRSKG